MKNLPLLILKTHDAATEASQLYLSDQEAQAFNVLRQLLFMLAEYIGNPANQPKEPPGP